MNVLIVDDDRTVVDTVRQALVFQVPDWRVISATDGPSALRALQTDQPEVVLLALSLPCMSGIEALRSIRETSDVPVIMLSSHESEIAVVQALEAGANDSVAKPFRLMELLARIRVQARNAGIGTATRGVASKPLCDAGLVIDLATGQVEADGEAVPLTRTETRLLCQLVRHPGRLQPYKSLLNSVWGSDQYGTDTVRVYVSRLRSKLPARFGRRIVTKNGLGYFYTRRTDNSA